MAKPLSAADEFAFHTTNFLEDMRKVRCTTAEFYEGLRAALEELEIEMQACKECM